MDTFEHITGTALGEALTERLDLGAKLCVLALKRFVLFVNLLHRHTLRRRIRRHDVFEPLCFGPNGGLYLENTAYQNRSTEVLGIYNIY